ncbi:DUF4350 domain-containing protein [Chryseobacterium sp. HSC-36S06]|uniref:DUF4350 domain-containing protein n=1 Tax=Chryseobacterium sp. HSC-36S06 TaxID=2910970 RepID=UPI0020A1AADB|nr:DUF4350 domain-containing protein [Chryseobacterium sp. HSC-36S06]MCP2039188.1 hypothetical protein [Chryseobacterium sp. HSC-36S06]
MNRTFRLYGIIFLIVLAVLALLEVNKTHITDWRKNFDIDKKTPFGLFVFNKEANHIFDNKLKKVQHSPFDYYKNSKKTPHNILVIGSEIDDVSWDKILDQVENGSDLMLFSERFPKYFSEGFGFQVLYEAYGEKNVLSLTDKKFVNDSLVLDKLPSERGFLRINEADEILGGNVTLKGNHRANFIKINYGDGNIYLHAEPLVLTNYYLLIPGNEKYVQNVFSYLPSRETIWFSEKNETSTESSSPMRFILSKPALRYAWWLLLGGLVLFVIFNAKRKQRIVPVIEPLKNKSVEFVKSIGNLYLQEGDFHDMMAKKAQFFLNKVRMDLLIDTQNLDGDFSHKLHLKTGKSLQEINEAVILIKKGQDPYASVMKEDLIRMNQLLDQILK